MKHIFILNPNSGKSKNRKKFESELIKTCDELGLEYEIYYTKAALDGQRYVRECCEKAAVEGKKLRVYGCGGDGTVNELVNGVYGFENVEFGIFPMGTGNDYIRNYGTKEAFLNIRNQILGKSKKSDLIKYKAEYNDKISEGLCANMFNIGFDCNVADLTARVKRVPFIQGSLAYLVAVVIMFVQKKGADLKIEFPDGKVRDGRILLIAVANGCFCGGGVKGVPKSILDDGLMDVSVVNNISRLAFLRLFSSYSKGTHLERKDVIKNNIIEYSKEKALTITANGESFMLCIDGEISNQNKVEFSMAEDAVKFIVPADIAD